MHYIIYVTFPWVVCWVHCWVGMKVVHWAGMRAVLKDKMTAAVTASTKAVPMERTAAAWWEHSTADKMAVKKAHESAGATAEKWVVGRVDVKELVWVAPKAAKWVVLMVGNSVVLMADDWV